MTPLWSAAELLNATGGTLSAPFDAEGISIDTRTIQPGDLFVALRGESGDGHDFVADAIAKGAAGAMVHLNVPDAGPLMRVDDTLAGLTRLGGYARTRFPGRVVAVTGSVGKTTTKEMLRTILSAFGRTHAAVASYNNHWGVPLTLARTPRDAAFCVVEIGMNHPGEIAPLSRLARPRLALITAIEKAHIGHLGGIEAIADEKASICRGLEPGGIAVLPADSPSLPRLRRAANEATVVTFGATPSADVRLLELAEDADGSIVLAEIDHRPVRFRVNAPGSHMAMNALAAIAAAVCVLAPGCIASAREQVSAADSAHVGRLFDLGLIARALETFVPMSGRGMRRRIAVPGGAAMLLDESYNANSASVRAALAVLRLQPARRRVAVLGDMLELGEFGCAEHLALAEPVSASADLLFTCGPQMRHLFSVVPSRIRAAHAADSEALAPLVAERVADGDVILVKGSLGSRMKTVVNALETLTAETN